MHAAVRLHLGRRGWDTAGDGVPINQQQLLGTMLSFSLLVTDALRALGFRCATTRPRPGSTCGA